MAGGSRCSPAGRSTRSGMTVDPCFNLYTADCHSKPMTQLIRGAVYQSFGKPHDGLGFGPDMIRHDHGSTGLCGLAWYEADQFPKEYQGGMFLGQRGDQPGEHGQDQVRTARRRRRSQQPDFLVSDDPWFRPVDITARAGRGAVRVRLLQQDHRALRGGPEAPRPRPDPRPHLADRLHRPGRQGAAPKSPGDLTKMKRDELDKLLGHPNINRSGCRRRTPSSTRRARSGGEAAGAEEASRTTAADRYDGPQDVGRGGGADRTSGNSRSGMRADPPGHAD